MATVAYYLVPVSIRTAELFITVGRNINYLQYVEAGSLCSDRFSRVFELANADSAYKYSTRGLRKVEKCQVQNTKHKIAP
jgi:hypothetical protein